jgi:hypothetical protein
MWSAALAALGLNCIPDNRLDDADQAEAEWVTVLTGSARIRIADQASAISLGPGDTLLLPAHCRHRVEWTEPDQRTIWLALFVDGELNVP